MPPTVLAKVRNNPSSERLSAHFKIPWIFQTMLKEWALPPVFRVIESPTVKPEAFVEDALAIFDQYHVRSSDMPRIKNVYIDSTADAHLLI
jgi:hypothetical protein